MNTDRPWDGEQDERKDKFPVGFFPIIEFDQKIDRDEKIQEEIAIEGKDIPGQKRLGKVHRSDERNHVPEPVEPSEVNHHKEDGHHDGGGGEEFPEDDDLFDRFEMVDIGRNDQQNRSRSQPRPDR